ncbi:MAG: YdeI/OmpD-associated family protein [Chitinophagales bacterium]|nr:DUF1905 domain-containing protein [Chitinophagales bacterium]MCB9032001.1 DUF1905 domain-containing protein [Chitinophagales bacterium]HPE98130.1 YdeI/OmpD-associated family protein [Chitinophagales bacterium]HQU39571.1 YdeI/OmpD-associated family protein [Chitinophagales bacterium]HQU75208.1 YdeI/OmpD-associated family protein [Chitinophagales bacterium]
MEEQPLVDKEYLLEKFPGKGGWTYAMIPEVLQDPHAPFGWVQVRGRIDSYTFDHYKLMPMGNGHLFLPVKKSVRKLLKKEAGDTVHVILYADDTPVEITQELLDCFALEDPKVLKAFRSLSDAEQKRFLEHIYSAKTDDVKTNRIASMISSLTTKSY